MKPTAQQIKAAVAQMTVLRFFPAEPIARATIMQLVDRMVSTPEQLEWLVTTMIDRVGEWLGPKELRAIFCTRFKPADGKEEWSTTAGFTAIDSENAQLERHGRLTAGDKERTGRLLSAGSIAAQIMPAEPEAEPPLSDEERASIAAFAAKLEARALKTAEERRGKRQRAQEREGVASNV